MRTLRRGLTLGLVPLFFLVQGACSGHHHDIGPVHGSGQSSQHPSSPHLHFGHLFDWLLSDDPDSEDDADHPDGDHDEDALYLPLAVTHGTVHSTVTPVSQDAPACVSMTVAAAGTVFVPALPLPHSKPPPGTINPDCPEFLTFLSLRC